MGADVDLTGGLTGRAGQRALEIASVDAFQGREKELIIFSAVRSNWQGAVGFLADWRRLNVMITRAKRGLCLVGNAPTLRCDTTWCKYIEWARDEGVAVGCPDAASGSGKGQQKGGSKGGKGGKLVIGARAAVPPPVHLP